MNFEQIFMLTRQYFIYLHMENLSYVKRRHVKPLQLLCFNETWYELFRHRILTNLFSF